ncbi:MAG: glutamate formimidoyltransferase [Elusimicrobia bacterium RIFCSPLOWO2_12_FULL_59_9]|nr:MAG: glutamate formimidoyltransferase [Elusimicrobia bacterium RIFCSPLOWO2_12_FULL_59_9]
MGQMLIQCVPNFSEGRDEAKISAVVEAARSVPGVIVLDVEKDADHNRTVLSFAAPPQAAGEAAFRVARKAAELIDLNHHRGEHPRMGAVDVIPFVPLLPGSLAECVELAKKCGERIGRELQIPVYLYDHAAQRPERRNLADVRKGQFEGLRLEIGKNPARAPDFGPERIHPTAGAVAVGAREQIINFNVNLESQDQEWAKSAAKKIRTSGGGLPALRAKEIFLKAKNQVQISTVLTDYKRTSLAAVFGAVESEAAAKKIPIADTEIIGLAPAAALVEFAADRLKLRGFNPETQILERQIDKLRGDGWVEGVSKLMRALAETTPTPGGGSAAAVAAGMGCALGRMAVGISIESFKKKPVAGAGDRIGELGNRCDDLAALGNNLERCVLEDAQAFEAVMAAFRIPKDREERTEGIQHAFKLAAETPIKTARLALRALLILADAQKHCAGSVTSDLKTGRHLCRAGIYGAIENVKINLASIKDFEFVKRKRREMQEILQGICD